MKATVERPVLNSALRRISTAVGSVVPLVVTVLEDGVELLGVGRDSVMYVDVEASVESPGCSELMLRQIMSVVKSLPNGSLKLESGSAGIGMALSGRDARVELTEQDELCGADIPEAYWSECVIEGELLRSSLQGVVTAVATDNHPIFGSVRLDRVEGHLRLVASDTYRLAVRDLPGTSWNASFSVNARSLKRMVRAFGKASRYRVGLYDGYVWFAVDGRGTMGIPCDHSDYPRYGGWSPPWAGRMALARKPLMDLARRAVALDRKAPPPIKVVFSAEGIEVTAKTQYGTVSGCLEADHIEWAAEEVVTLRFNSRFLADALANLVSDRVEISVAEDPLARPKPVRIADGRQPEAWNLVMPMRAG